MQADVAVVGAGPAGLAAAVAAAESGAAVVLVDAGAQPGGQFWRHRPETVVPEPDGAGAPRLARPTSTSVPVSTPRAVAGRSPTFPASRSGWRRKPSGSGHDAGFTLRTTPTVAVAA